ncbi:MAG: biotin--[acetyl-CoA-carboxylase] ligase [candidate division WOR-3 bacterium]|nr:biotin--[acetyl-CoA-carboxylase] ligase [candidate division WOR-3 bacterium]
MGHTVFSFLQVTSTQEKAKELIKNNVDNGTVVVSRIQTYGKGRGNNIWISEVGGLYFSIIYQSVSSNDQSTTLTKIIGIGVKSAIEKILLPIGAVNLEIKGINDVLLNKKKVAGVLVETESFVGLTAQISNQPKFYLLGIGINVNQKSFPQQLKDVATSLLIETGQRISRFAILKAVCEELGKLLD